MSTDIVTREPMNLPSVQEWNAVVGQAEALAASNIVPKPFRGKPADIVAVTMIGRPMGLDLMQSMQYIHVIDGKPAMSAELMNSRVRAAGHGIRVLEHTNDVCRIIGTRRDTGEEMEVSFSLADARLMGVVKPGGNWEKVPRAMTWARALSMLCRMLFPDVIMGASYVPEELGAEVDEDGHPVNADAPTTALPDDLAAEVANAVEVEVIPEPVERVEPEAASFAVPGSAEPNVAPEGSAFAQPTPPPPPTAEEAHVLAGQELFSRGWPMGRCKGGDPTDPNAVDTNSLEFMAGLPIKDDKWKATEVKRRTWIAAEIERRARLLAAEVPSAAEIREAARTPRSGETHGDLDAAAAEAAAREDDGAAALGAAMDAQDAATAQATMDMEFPAPTASTPEFPPPVEPPADALDAPLNDTWHNRMIDAMIECGFATTASAAAGLIGGAVQKKADAGEPYPANSWAAGQIEAFRNHAAAAAAK